MILVSACLLGKNCKYNGKNNDNAKVHKFLAGKDYCSFCPECLGNLPIPRPPIELNKNRQALDKNGEDKTEQFLIGANKTLKLCKDNDAKLIILKDGSPSCGVHYIYDGTFTNKKIRGLGMTAKLLAENGYEIISEKDL